MKTAPLGLSRTLGAAIATIALTALLSAGAVLFTFSELRSAVDARTRSVNIIRALDDFRVAMLNQETGLRGLLLTGQKSSLQPYDEGRVALDRSTARLKLLLRKESEIDLFGEAENAARIWQTDIGESVVRMLADPNERSAAMALESNGDGKKRFDTFRTKLAGIEGSQDENLNVQSAVVVQATRNATIAFGGGTLVVLVVCGFIALAIRRGIAQPLTELAMVMGRLAQRDLTATIPALDRRNEVGDMARAVEVFKGSLIELDRTSLLRATADTLPAMVGYIDAGRRIGFLNSEFARWFDLGVADVAEVYGRPLTRVFGDVGFPGGHVELAAAFAGEEIRFEHRLTRRGGDRRAVEAFYRPHIAPNGLVLGVVTLFTDITDRKSMEIRLAQQTRDLKRSNEELEQFAYVASHDLKAPLRGIENLVTWIEEDLEGPVSSEVATNMGLLKNRVRRLESLLDDLLAYSRAGRGELVKDRVDTRTLVSELAILVSPPEGFSIEGAPDLPTLEAARAPLTQVLQNLIGNAIKHHERPSAGHVFVEARATGPMIEIVVTDDGPGVPAQFRDRVFGMFQTLRPRDEVEGSGMGLAIVKKIVERQGGKIWLDEGRDGRGLAVHFTWPDGEKESGDGANREFATG